MLNGTTKLILNHETICALLASALNSGVFDKSSKVKVSAVKAVNPSNYGSGQDSFEVSAEPEEKTSTIVAESVR